MKKSQILREAYKLIESTEQRYVCWAILAVGDNYRGVSKDSKKLVAEIGQRFTKNGLSVNASVNSWLHVVHKIPFEEMTPWTMRKYRLAWLDNWASELEAKGE